MGDDPFLTAVTTLYAFLTGHAGDPYPPARMGLSEFLQVTSENLFPPAWSQRAAGCSQIVRRQREVCSQPHVESPTNCRTTAAAACNVLKDSQ